MGMGSVLAGRVVGMGERSDRIIRLSVYVPHASELLSGVPA
jgi:hypothetical protein